MPTDHTEKGFENAIESSLLASGGFVQGDPNNFNRELALDQNILVAFLKDSQPDVWDKLEVVHGSDAATKIVQYIATECDQRGMLDVLRKGITDHGVKIRLAFFRPASGLNDETLALYGKNVLTITRQVKYSTKNENSIDVLISLNGLPIATAELKNPFTKQTVEHAIRQYQETRDPNEPLFRFKARALVHFAVDPDLVYMTTRLAGKSTRFLPFNLGDNGGKGNPSNVTGYKTSYLWEIIWQRESWLDIIARFIHLQKDDGKERIIFPRYHQLDAVRRLVAHSQLAGEGQNYLIQHSAGSGKSNTIGWLAHRLANLHDGKDKVVFDSIIVITDRRILDKQLQDTIYQFDHKQGVVAKIDENSKQLGEALKSGTRIIITTLQKFSFVMEKTAGMPKRRYAVIVDEAHSSQSGESAANLRRVLGAKTLNDAEKEEAAVEEIDPIEDEIVKTIESRGPQKNICFFAFTATPKFKTLKLFGQPGIDGKPLPFHLYSMRQAIEEGFILNVLRNYTTYKLFYRLTKAVEDDPEVEKRKAVRAIARFVSLHPHNLAQKTEVMVEHFRQFTRHKIGGKAKAMVVTRSRLHAVRYKMEFDRYLAEKGYTDTKVLVAFSGTVMDENGLKFTEPEMNGFPEKEVPERFKSDDYQILLVAEKYQTGFDQPLLHTMYVDKKLDGLHAVQTLSRLNRIYPGKEDTFILDFVNEVSDIKDAFKPYYEQTEIADDVDPNLLYQLKTKLDAVQIFWQSEIDQFAKVFFKPKADQKPSDQGQLHKIIDPAVDRFKATDEEAQEAFRHTLQEYLRLYAFLSQIINFVDVDLEKLYAYGRLLATKLPKRKDEPLNLDGDVAMTYYRLQKMYEGAAALNVGETSPIFGPGEVGTGKNEKIEAPLSEIIHVLNEKFGTDFTPEDQLLFDQVIGDLISDEEMRQQAVNNTLDQFRLVFDKKAIAAFLERMERNENITSKFMSNENLRKTALEWMLQQVFVKSRHTSKAY